MGERLYVFDNVILAFFTRISHAFQRLTGRTNYFLAKICAGAIVTGCFVEIWNYWIPVLSWRSDGFDVFVDLWVGIFFARLAYVCGKADERVLSGKEFVNPLTPEVRVFINMGASWRVFIFCINYIITLLFILHELELIGRVHGIFFFRVLDYLMVPANSLFLYFIAVFPLPPGKSKVQEWIESVAVGFRKQVEVKAQ